MSATVVDAVVIGAGMAGLSAGAELARTRSVALLEAESVPAFHTTGRSAAVYIERYGGPAVAPFNLASHPWFTSTAEGLLEHPLLTPRGMLVLAAPGSVPDQAHDAEPSARDLDAPGHAGHRDRPGSRARDDHVGRPKRVHLVGRPAHVRARPRGRAGPRSA